MNQDIKTTQTHPQHHTVGGYFFGWPNMYFCDSYDPRIGYWMTNILNPSDRRNVSERAINRTFHEQHGHVRRHHEHHPEAEYHSVDIRTPDAEPQPFDYDKAATHDDANVLVFFNRFYALDFRRLLKKAVEARDQAQVTA